jgi:hypothetical protein
MIRKSVYFLAVLFSALSATAQHVKLLQFREEAFDFGNVVEENGPVMHEFMFTNASGRPVKILSVQASCGCTTPDWTKAVIASGKTGFIQASYNPEGRPGYFNKTLTVTTDLDGAAIMLQIKGQVISAGDKPATTEFQSANGSWKFKTSSFNMGKIYLKDEFVAREFTFVNSGNKPVTYLDKVTAPAYIRVEVQPKTIAPGALGVVKVKYNGKIKNQYGFQSDNVEIQTDDVLTPVKSFSVYATLEDFFSTLTAEELSKSPRLTVASASVDFARLKQNVPAVKEVEITNTGSKELLIKSIQGNCTCISASAVKNSLKSGESSVIQITFNPQDRKGTQTKSIMIYSNDPHNPVQRVIFTAYVED